MRLLNPLSSTINPPLNNNLTTALNESLSLQSPTIEPPSNLLVIFLLFVSIICLFIYLFTYNRLVYFILLLFISKTKIF
jgi:hypothetical protein